MIKELKKIDKIQLSMIIFVLIQPILDFYIFFETNKNILSSFALPTVIRFLFISGMTIWLWFSVNPVSRKKIISFFGIILLYSLLHWIFSSVLYRGPGNFSWLGELFYLARLTILMLMLSISQQFKYNEKQLEFLIYCLIFLISGTIVILNLLGKSLGSYSHQMTNVTIFDWSSDLNKNGFLQSATKGIFMYANQVSAILVFLLPLALNYYFKRPNLIKFLGLLTVVLSGLMLGTRVAAIGLFAIVLLSLILCIVFYKNRAKKISWGLLTLISGWLVIIGMSPVVMRHYVDDQLLSESSSIVTVQSSLISGGVQIFNNISKILTKVGMFATSRGVGVLFLIFIISLFLMLGTIVIRGKKKQWLISSLVFIVFGWVLLFGISPVIMRQHANNENKKTQDAQQSKINQIINQLSKIEKDNNQDKLIEFIGINYQIMSISHEIINYKYSYKNDPIFWAAMFREPLKCRIDNRCIQDKIAARIASKDTAEHGFIYPFILKLFGTGYTRADSLFPIEKDFLSHYRNLGVIGMIIFTAIYIILLGLAMVNFICAKKEQRLESALIAMAIGMLVVAAYMSGNTLDSLFVMLIVCFVMGQYVGRFKNNLQWLKIKSYLDKTQVSQKSTAGGVNIALSEKVKSQTLIITANPETFEKALNDSEFNKLMIDGNTIITPDGIGVIVAARLFGYKIKDRISGVELTQKLLEIANQKRLTVSSLGATNEVASDFERHLKTNYPDLKIGKIIDGYGKNRQADVKTIVKSKSQIVLFALGSGEQEKVASHYLDQAKDGVAIGVGGTLDVLTGRVKRAPDWVIKTNLEWLYRVIKQPKRIARLFRYNGKFLLRIVALYTIKTITLNEE